MKWRRLSLLLVRFAVLFAVSGILVGGFWFHAEFYRLGLPVILAAGPIAVILVIAAFRFGLSGEFNSLIKPRKNLHFAYHDIEKIRHGVKTALIRKSQNHRDVKPGSVVNARIKESGVDVCRLRIVGTDRAYLEDLSQSEVASLGLTSKSELSELLTSLESPVDDTSYWELVFFRPLETGKGQ